MKCKDCIHCKHDGQSKYGTCQFPGLNLDGMAQIGGMIVPAGFPGWCRGAFKKKEEPLAVFIELDGD